MEVEPVIVLVEVEPVIVYVEVEPVIVHVQGTCQCGPTGRHACRGAGMRFAG